MLVKSTEVPLALTDVPDVNTPTPVGVPAIAGLVRVLFVSVSVVVLPTNVSVVVGKVSVVVPDTAGDSREIDPDVEPLKISLAKFSLQCF
jgi:hypothetical protein